MNFSSLEFFHVTRSSECVQLGLEEAALILLSNLQRAHTQCLYCFWQRRPDINVTVRYCYFICTEESTQDLSSRPLCTDTTT